MKKKVLAALLAATMTMGLLAGCGAKEEAPASSEAPAASEAPASSEAPAEEEYVPTYPYETDVTLKIWIDGLTAPTSNADRSQVPFYQGLAEVPGFDIEWMYPAQGADGAAAYNLMMQDAELPHIVVGYHTNASHMQDVIDDGVALNVYEYLEEYAPAYWELLNSGDPYVEKNKKLLAIEDGTIPAFGSFRSTPWGCTYQGILVRQDINDELGLTAPATIAEMEEYLGVLKDKKGMFWSSGFKNMGYGLSSAFGAFSVDHGHYVDKGVVKANVEAPGLKDMITELHDWYAKGLLDPNFATAKNDYLAQMNMEEKMGVSVNALSQQTRWRNDSEAAGKLHDWVGIPSMTNEAGDTVHYIQTEYSTYTGSFGCYITTACDTEEELKAAMAWVDWAYTEEGQMYWNFGTEGVSYEMVDGMPQFTDLLWNDERGIAQALLDYTGASGMPAGIQLEEFVRAKNSAVAGPSVDAWISNQDASDYWLPGMNYPDDVRQQNTDISTALTTYVSENLTKMIVGDISIDAWDDFIAQCKSMGLDTQTANIQAAYDEFMK